MRRFDSVTGHYSPIGGGRKGRNEIGLEQDCTTAMDVRVVRSNHSRRPVVFADQQRALLLHAARQRMSSYVVNKATIDEIVGATIHFGLSTPDLADTVGQILWDANRAAVAYRYNEPVTEAEYRYEATPATIGQRARSLSNYCYQCVDHPAWRSFEAREIAVVLAVAFLSEVPGYADGESR